jgi:peroxiredoxin family protein
MDDTTTEGPLAPPPARAPAVGGAELFTPPVDESLLRELIAREVERRTGELQAQVDALRAKLEASDEDNAGDRATLLVFSNDLDRLLSAFIIATSSVAMGLEVSMYFTFWGLTALRRRSIYRDKGIAERLLTLMTPGGPAMAPTSKLNMGGMGPLFLKHLMRKSNVQSVPEMLALAQELGVELIACQMAMGVMGISEDELIEGVSYGGAATYVGHAARSRLTLFI